MHSSVIAKNRKIIMNLNASVKELAYYMRRLYRQKLTTTLGGNLSMRLDNGNIIITPSATDKGRMTGDEIGIMDIDGKICGPEFKPSIETEMHLNVYRTRSDINAVVHAHPVTACAFAAASAEINCNLIIESSAMLGKINYAGYHPMGSNELAKAVAEAVVTSNTVIMKNHGVLTAGENIIKAFERLEVLENAAQMTLIAEGSFKNRLTPLPEQLVD